MKIKKNVLLILILIFINLNTYAQYYYSDILSNKLANETYISLLKNKITKIITTNIIQNQESEQKLQIIQTFSDNWSILSTESNSNINSNSNTSSYYQNNKIIKSEGEKTNLTSYLTYEYNNENKLATITTATIDTSVDNGFKEKHLFYYDAKGIISTMIKIKNNIDTTFVTFIKDDNENIIEENWLYKSKIVETYYYYYNDNKLLTDIVKFNLKAKKMLPEFLFEYDSNNKLSQMIQIPFGSSNYLIWKYTYDTRGLKQSQFCFSKNSELLGKMDYVYE